MMHMKRLLCLLLALICVGAMLAGCGGDTTDGDGSNGGNDNNATTTDPTGTTVAPCTTHTYAKGSLCTTDRTCTVCGQVAPAAADHTPGVMASCGYQACTVCSYVLAEQPNRHSYVNHICSACGKKQPAIIEEITINGRSIAEYKLVTPHKDKGESYLAKLIDHRVNVWHYEDLNVISHNLEKTGPEIRIGQTNRTVTTVADNEYKICVVGEDLEIVFGSNLYAYEGALQQLCNIFDMNASEIHLTSATNFGATYENNVGDALDGDLRIMFHNVLRFQDNWNSASRATMFRMIYGHYQPDIIGMQEAIGEFFDANNGIAIKTYLEGTLKYKSLSYGMAEVMWYNPKTVKLIKQDYIKTEGNYGTNWALFQHIATGKYFGVENSHFAANSVARPDMSGNEMRIRDAESVVEGRNKLVAAAREAGVANPQQLPIITGGDYNSNVGSDPIAVLDNAGFVNMRVAVDDKTKVDDFATHNGAPQYNETFDYHPPNYYTSAEGSGKNSIDHSYSYNEGVSFTANQYRIVRNMIAAGASDHMPHYVDITLN